jgi:ribosomal protein S14
MSTTDLPSSSSSNPKQQRCNSCGRTFDTIEELNLHKKLDHSTTSQPPVGIG